MNADIQSKLFKDDAGERRMLLSDDCPRSAELYAALGFEVVAVDISEFQKLEGAVTCLSVLAISP